MTTQNLKLALRERNDETVFLTITKDGVPFDITGLTVELYLKDSPAADDTAGTKLSSTVPGEITITDAPNGLATANISAAVTSAPVKGKFFRIDVLDADGKRKTVGYGNYDIVDL